MAEALPVRVDKPSRAPLAPSNSSSCSSQDELTRRSDRLFARRLKQAGIIQVKELTTSTGLQSQDPAAKLVDLATARFIADITTSC